MLWQADCGCKDVFRFSEVWALLGRSSCNARIVKAKLTELLKQQGELKSSLVETEEAWMEVMEAISLAE